jgi:hypothetical protein
MTDVKYRFFSFRPFLYANIVAEYLGRLVDSSFFDVNGVDCCNF